MKKARNAFIRSVLVLLLCVSMLVGTTFAWFSETITNNNNRIMAGNLDVAMYWTDDLASGTWTDAEDPNAAPVFDYDNWEPGYTLVRYIKIANEGSLALKYQLSLIADGVVGPLADVIDVYYVQNAQANIAGRDELKALAVAGTLKDVLDGSVASVGGIMPAGETETGFYSGEVVVAIAMKMQESAGNEYMNQSIGSTFSISLVATQTSNESDSFGKDYDETVEFPKPDVLKEVTVPVTPDANNQTTADIVISDGGDIFATVPAGTTLKDGTTELTLTVSNLESTNSNIQIDDDEIALSLDVHVEGVAQGNETPIAVTMKGMMPVGLNMNNYELYHVENGVSLQMTLLADGAIPVHNNFTYDPATGDVVLYMKSFSEVAMLANTVNPWEGNRDYSWYDANATELTIANADQLAAFGALVGGMAKDENGNFLITYEDSDGDVHHNDFFAGKTVKLLANINLGDKESENNENLIFYPIGYWNSEETYEKDPNATEGVSSGFYAFEGTFDGNGNTIANFYQNTWEMKGDHDWYDAKLQYYRDGMGLFGKILGGTVKNLTVKNFSCDSEIGTSGVIAAYADSMDGKPATFENIAIFNCNPRVYNIGNGGIVGCAGWYSRNDSLYAEDYANAVTFRNITVDQTNKISALWGSWGVSCAGILGQYYPNSSCGIKLENCHVAAVIDVNNDVCSNYQYYWYRYAGMFIGTIRENTTDKDGYTVADTTGVTATGCTYTMGDWNEYWYCEIVANSLASYTHDHQFSRLDNIYDLSEISDDGGVTWKKEGHFALLDENRDIVDCYHIFKNSEGNLYRHFHDSADESNNYSPYETFDLNKDGELNDLKEDRQRYFIPFNQLLTGLDMGIKAHTEFEGIEFVENGVVKSEKKFELLGTVVSYRPGETITLGQLVESIVDDSKLSKASIYAAVSPATEGDRVSATYSLDMVDWRNSKITFGADCTGAVKIVITDYFYCTETVVYLHFDKVVDRYEGSGSDDAHKWDYRTFIEMGDIFALVDGTCFNGNVTVKVTAPDKTVSYLNATAATWETASILLNQEGEWKFEIRDEDLPTGGYYGTSVTITTENKEQDGVTDNFSVTNTETVDYSEFFPQNP